MAESRVFQRIKPYCIQVAQKPTLEHILDLKATLQLVNKIVFKEESLVQYVLFPLKLTIQRIKHSNEKILLVVLDCICLLFSHHNTDSEQLLLEIFDICCILLSSQKQSVGKEMVARISDELKIKIVNLMNILLLGSNTPTLISLYSEPVLPRLGHAVSILLCLSEFEKERELRLASNECLQNLTLKHKSVNDLELQLISDAYCSFIPGISMAFSRILLDSSNTGHAVFASVIETLKDFIVLVMGDCRFTFLQQSKSMEEIAMDFKLLQYKDQQSKLPENVEIHDEKSFTIKRDKKWLEKTASNISILIRKFASRAAHHSSPKVRSATVSFAKSLLVKCGTSMDASVPTLIEILAGMQHDEYDIVSMEAKRAIECCRAVLDKGLFEAFLCYVFLELFLLVSNSSFFYTQIIKIKHKKAIRNTRVLNLLQLFCEFKMHIRIKLMVNNISIVQVGPYIKLINLVKNFPRNIFSKIFDHSNSSPCFQNRLSYVTL